MNKERMEELAALHAMNLLDKAGEKELLTAAQSDAEVRELVRSFTETAAQIAYEVPQIEPPPQLKKDLLRQLPVAKRDSKIIRFPSWIPYAIAAGLMVLGLVQALKIVDLKGRVQILQSRLVAEDAETIQLRQTNALKDLRLSALQEAAGAQTDTRYAASQVLVAWAPAQNRGTLSMRDLPAPPPGHDYQLWVLDPNAASPISAGLISGSRSFAVQPVGTTHPGFAISLEPAGGRPTPTGPILFATAPGP